MASIDQTIGFGMLVPKKPTVLEDCTRCGRSLAVKTMLSVRTSEGFKRICRRCGKS